MTQNMKNILVPKYLRNQTSITPLSRLKPFDFASQSWLFDSFIFYGLSTPRGLFKVEECCLQYSVPHLICLISVFVRNFTKVLFPVRLRERLYFQRLYFKRDSTYGYILDEISWTVVFSTRLYERLFTRLHERFYYQWHFMNGCILNETSRTFLLSTRFHERLNSLRNFTNVSIINDTLWTVVFSTRFQALNVNWGSCLLKPRVKLI